LGAFLAADLQFISTEASDLHDDLNKRTLHAAFFTGRLSHPDLGYVTLFQEPFTVVLHSNHSLAQSRLLSLEDLENEPVVWLRRDVNPLLYDSLMDSCSSRGYRPNVVQEVRTFSECLEFAREKLGITFLPSFMQSSYRDESVVFIRLSDDSLHMEYRLAYRRNGESEDVARFVTFVQDHARQNNEVGLPARTIID
jgi:DNA-binding transcriptional LysR family regulator